MSYIPEPVTRTDKYLAYIAGNMDIALPESPITRKEYYLAAWAKKSGFEDVEVQGTPPILFENGIGTPLKGLNFYGRSEQVTTTGAQLLDPSKLQSSGDTTFKIENNGKKISITGKKAWAGARINKNDCGIFDSCIGKKVTISCKIHITNGTQDNAKIVITIPFTTANGDINYISMNNTGNGTVSVNVPLGATIQNLQINVNHSATDIENDITVMFEDLMIYTSSETLEWEPYTGGIPSPNPDYPQEIKSVANPIVKVCGKNLLELTDTQVQEGKLKFEINQGIVVFDGSVDNTSFIYKIKDFVVPNDGTYTITTNSDNNSNDSPRILISINGGSYESALNGVIKKLSTGDTVTLYIRINTTGSYDGRTIKPMIELGSTATAYEPYHEPQSMPITTPNGLPGIPVTSGGNYADENGQQWICDEVDFGRGVYVQRIETYSFSGDEFIKNSGTYPAGDNYTDETIRYQYNLSNNVSGSDYRVVCTHFASGRYSTNVACAYDGMIFLFVQSAKFPTVNDFTDFLKKQKEKSTPVEVSYILTTPIETPLTVDQLAAYKQLHTYKGTTIIDNDAGAYMSVKYEKMK